MAAYTWIKCLAPKRLALLAFAFAAGLVSSCGQYERMDNNPVADRGRHDVLAAFEAADWPDYLHKLALPRARDYVIFSFIPTRHPVDLSSPARAKRTILRQVMDPGFDTKLGHTIIGWQCGEYQGMTSMSGAMKPSPVRMVRSGWGFTAAFSTFTDGHLNPEGEHRVANLEALAEGRAFITAIEVNRASCKALRDRLRAFVTHPNDPARNFGLLEDPEKYEGGGCISFGFFLANAAGVMRGVKQHIEREVPIYSAMLGQGKVIPSGVRLYRPPTSDCCDQAVPIRTLLAAPWDRGTVVDRVRIVDGELVIAALASAREGISPVNDWRFDRALPDTDPAVARAAKAGHRFASAYPVRRIVDPDGMQALVLENR